MLRFLIGLAGAGLLGAIGYYGALRPAPGPLAAYTGFAERIEARLQAEVDEALSATGFDWAEVEMDGQIAILTGQAPREDERGEARSAVLAAAGPGGLWAGGVIRVEDRATLAPPVSPYEWSVERDGERAVLRGAAPSRALRADLVGFAAELFPGGVVDEMIIARGAPDGDELTWAGIARAAIEQAARLADGRAVLRDERLQISGETLDARTRDRITGEIARLPAPYLAVARIDAPEEAGVDAALDPEDDGVDMSAIDDIAVCQDMFDALAAEDGGVAFSDAAVIQRESYPALDRLAIAARRCESFAVVAVGRVAEGGETLAREHAEAVANYFVLQGVAPERVTVDVAGASAEGDADAPLVVFRIQD